MELKDITKEAAVINSDQTFADAVRKMIKEQANALIVVDEDGKFAGEVNVSDLFDAIVPEYLDGDTIIEYFADEDKFAKAVKDAAEKPVESFMSRDAEPVGITDSIINVAAVAVAHQHSRIPVVDHSDRPIGVISRRGLKQIIGNFMNIKE